MHSEKHGCPQRMLVNEKCGMAEESSCRAGEVSVKENRSSGRSVPGRCGDGVLGWSEPPYAGCSQEGDIEISQLSWLRNFRYSPRHAELTSTQRLVIQFVACGLSDKEIAYFLKITCATVKAHNAAILKALNFYRRSQLVRYVFESNRFDPEEAQRVVEARKVPQMSRCES